MLGGGKFVAQAGADDGLAGGEQRLVFRPLGQARRLDIPDAIIGQLKSGQVKLPALGVHRQRDFAPPPRRLLSRGQRLKAIDSLHFHAKRELPALRQRDRRADAGVRAGADADGDALDLRSPDLGLAKRGLDQLHRSGVAALGDRLRREKPLAVQHRDAPVIRRKLNRQNLHE